VKKIIFRQTRRRAQFDEPLDRFPLRGRRKEFAEAAHVSTLVIGLITFKTVCFLEFRFWQNPGGIQVCYQTVFNISALVLGTTTEKHAYQAKSPTCLPSSGWNHGRLNIADDFRGACHAAEHFMLGRVRGNQLRNWHPPFGYNDRLATPANILHDTQAVRRELSNGQRFHSDLLLSMVKL
jgi:hypothetical protein